MELEFGLTKGLFNTKFAPLAAIGHYILEEQYLKPLTSVEIRGKSVKFTPKDKLVQVFVSILAGCTHLSLVNTRLIPDHYLANCWGWESFTDQSNLSRNLDYLTQINLSQLREAVRTIWQARSRTFRHDWRSFLWLDFDLSGLPCGKKSEQAKKGYFSGKRNITGRQLARVSATEYGETIWSELYPGNRHTITCLEPAVLASESSLDLSPTKRKRVVWRLDGASGSDAFGKIRWMLARDYQLIAKGYSNVRAHKLAKQVYRWDPYGDAWLGEVAAPVDWGREVTVLVKKRLKKAKFVHSYYIFTLKMPSKRQLMNSYERRGGAEVEQFRHDKSGLALDVRRKRKFLAQQALILLTDLAHNFLAYLRHQILVGSSFANFGPQRIVRDLLSIPGRLVFSGTQLKRIDLIATHPYARELLMYLQKPLF